LEGRLLKNCIHAIFKHEFSVKTHLLFMPTNDAPSMVLFVYHLMAPRNPGKRVSNRSLIRKKKKNPLLNRTGNSIIVFYIKEIVLGIPV